jgi:methionyl-tRNA synthetase
LVGAHGLLAALRPVMEAQAFNEALEIIWRVVRDANRNIDTDAPWKLRKTDPDEMEAVLHTLMETIRHLAIVLRPFMPDSCDRMLDQLGVEENSRDFNCLNNGSQPFDENSLKSGLELPKPEPVFPRYVEETAES